MFKSLLNRILPASPPPAPAPADPARADALIAEGDARENAGDLAQAEALYRAAIAAAPGHARAHLYLGIVLAARNEQDGAIAAYEQVLAIDPAHAFGNYNYARLAFLRGDLARAESLIGQALRAKPEFVQALVVQSDIRDALGMPEQAVESLREALRLDPSSGGAWFNLALICLKLDRAEDAEDAVRHAVQIEPDNPAPQELLARVMNNQGFAQEALDGMQKVIELDPSAWAHRSMALMLMNFVPGIPAREIFRRHVEFGADLERAVPVRFEKHRDRGDPQRRLRIGYVSADFLLHPVTVFLAPVLESHDRAQVEVFCYSLTTKQDPLTARLRAATDHWRDAAAMSDIELADAIHADGIDVLVDLMGHTSHPRLVVFCQRPAPVQVAWLGYLNTTGLTRMDFRITDVRCDPPASSQPLHTERLFNLPCSQWCYRAMSDQPADPVSPFERNGHITFGSFNAGLKITQEACRRWAQVLLRVPGSRLVVGDVKSERKRSAIRHELVAAGIAPDRLEFLPRVPLDEYLALYNRVDLTFDTSPYGGGTTTFDSLWMGAPVVATVGDTPVSRSAASILTALDMDDWIAPSADEFVDVAVARAHDRAGLQSLRRGLRARLLGSLLTELPRYTRDLEAAYRAMWLEKTAADE
jgi:protein O-GlcNAc transferase